MSNGMTFDKVEFIADDERIVLKMMQGTRPYMMSDITIQARKGKGQVWYDSYRNWDDGDGDGDHIETIYAHLDPDVAEQIGIALIQAANIARNGYDPGN